jgi:ribosomal protein S18 acetylase RimI-like enzyme
MSGTQIAMLDPGRLDELEPLWLALHRHHRAVADLAVLRDDALSWRRRRDWYAAMLSGGHDFALVARIDGEPEPVGYAFVHIRPGDDDTWPVGSHMAELVSLAVAPDRRGHGIGTALMDAVDAELDLRGVADLEVAVMAGNDGARRFYERRGLRLGELLLFRFGGGEDGV